MKITYLLITLPFFFSYPAMAQSSYCVNTCCNSINWCNSTSDVTIISDNTVTVCDSNEKTPAESIDCKVRYWRDETERLQKIVDEDQKKLDHARDRLRAFQNLSRP